ncbi:MAG TPA: cation-transporting P-type ATPase [Methanospirillum sp.]|nr:cation-transporting P-type ATPase [Methanospirillum sp.]
MNLSIESDGKDTPGLQVHTALIPDVYSLFETSPSGLSEIQARKNLITFGKNTLIKTRKKSIVLRFLANFSHLMAILLWIGGIVAIFAQMIQLGIAIWMVNLINGLFSFWQEFRAEKAAEALMTLLPRQVRVIRDGGLREIPAEDLVPGDILVITEGDHISADARLVEEAALKIDQSTLTGESHPVKKTSEPFSDAGFSRIELPNLIFAGTNVVSGTGKAVVISTGMHTEFGKVADMTQAIGEEQSPLQKEMVYVTRMVTVVAVSVGFLFFLLLLTMTSVSLTESFIFALGMIVAFVPEGLLPTVTLALARGSQRMAKRHALIKRLSAVETLGCTTVICTDKTGTLTQNEMTVKEIWVSRRSLTVTGVGYTPKGEILTEDNPVTPDLMPELSRLLVAAGLCNNARLIAPDTVEGQWSVLGDPTEAALLVAAQKGGVDIDQENMQFPRIRELPFDSRRKLMSTIHKSGNQEILFLKGAPKEVLGLSSVITLGGEGTPLTDDIRSEIMDVNDSYALKGLRVIAVAIRHLPGDISSLTPEVVECDLTFIGLIAMMDPPRPEVADAVIRCNHASIRIIMITGDYGLTAKSIARRIGIITSETPRIVTGSDLDGMDDSEMREILKEEVIFARVAPEHKLKVVTVLKEMGHIVAVTGDGVNDAPALKKADIGVAMGITGTDVAKEAADMVLTDDNFASIVNAVEEGRAVYANIKKFTGYIFTSNTPEAVPFILFAFSKTRIPLALDVMPILAIDLGTDLAPALALGSEAPEEGIMNKPPRNLSEHVISRSLLIRSYLWLGPIQSVVVMAAFYYQYWTNGFWGHFFDLPATGPIYHSAVAMALAAVVSTQIGNVLAQRTERRSIFEVGLFSNRMVWAGIASEVVIILLIIYVPFLQQIIGTAPFPLENWLFLIACTPILLIAEEIRKGIARRMEQKEMIPAFFRRTP